MHRQNDTGQRDNTKNNANGDARRVLLPDPGRQGTCEGALVVHAIHAGQY